jgi:phosphatidylglycerophosphate synthase
VATTLGALLLAQMAAADSALPWRALVLGLAGGAIVFALAARELRAPAFGAANRVTLARGALAMLLLALLGARAGQPHAWWIVALATGAAVLDGVDGRLARTRGETTAFGARFDMETDALLILVLSLLAWQLGKAGAWVVLAGALRYLFVAASWVAPWLARALPPSRRRQAICVVQIVSLIACLSPVLMPPVSGAVALVGLVALAASFGVDVVFLARRARH